MEATTIRIQSFKIPTIRADREQEYTVLKILICQFPANPKALIIAN